MEIQDKLNLIKDLKSEIRKNIKRNTVNYILNCINTDDYDGYNYDHTFNDKPETIKQKLQFLFDTFNSEYGYNIKSYGMQNAFKNWVQGLPSCFSIDYTYYNIINIAIAWGSIDSNATESQKDKIINNWFQYITNNTFQLFRKYRIK